MALQRLATSSQRNLTFNQQSDAGLQLRRAISIQSVEGVASNGHSCSDHRTAQPLPAHHLNFLAREDRGAKKVPQRNLRRSDG
jgi:hypothetical protein